MEVRKRRYFQVMNDEWQTLPGATVEYLLMMMIITSFCIFICAT